MEKTLVIVESPAKAKSIGKFLGSKFFVKASMGHLRDLPKSQFGVDPEKGFEPKYIAIRGKGDIIKELKSAAKKAGRVFLASDPDREGEAIAWHLQHLLDLDPGEKCRIEFNEITKNAIQNAVKNPRAVDMNRVNAQQARRIMDRLVGYNLSPLLWKKVKKGLSAGRVQSVAVRLICDREEEVQSFVPEEYWTLTARLAKNSSDAFDAKLHRIGDKKADISHEARVKEIIKDLRGKEYAVAKVVRKEKLRQPPAPFITSTLQQEAYRKLNFAARKTMSVAQQLYEGIELGKDGPSGLVTYIRTDSTRVSDAARQETLEYIRSRFGEQFAGGAANRPAGKGKVQDAHEAIRPTYVIKEPDQIKAFLSNDQYKLYRLIWERFVASQMSAAVMDTTSVDIKAGDYTFRAAGSIVKFQGYMKVYTEARDEGNDEDENRVLPVLEEGDRLEKKSLTPKQHFTQPPPRYTDATLIRALEEKGIGRPSTYAPIVETIQKRGYVIKEKKQYVPTELGMVVVNLLKDYFKDIIDVEFTAAMEEKLDNVEEGDVDWTGVLKDFYAPFKTTLSKAEKEIGHVDLADEVTDELCPNCQRNLVVKMGRYGKFLACPGFPDCRYTKPLLEPTGVKCPECPGELVLRRSKKGRAFYGCDKYPECQFSVWDRPSPEKCPECGGLMVIKKYGGRETLKCVSEKCAPREKRRTADASAKKKMSRKAGAKTAAKSGAKAGAKAVGRKKAKGVPVPVDGEKGGKIASGR